MDSIYFEDKVSFDKEYLQQLVYSGEKAFLGFKKYYKCKKCSEFSLYLKKTSQYLARVSAVVTAHHSDECETNIYGLLASRMAGEDEVEAELLLPLLLLFLHGHAAVQMHLFIILFVLFFSFH